MSYHLKDRKVLPSPIDYDKLALAYSLAKWRWHDGVPNQERLQLAIAAAVVDLAQRPGHDMCASSGGYYVEWAEGCREFTPENIVVKIHPELAAHYFAEVAATASMGQ